MTASERISRLFGLLCIGLTWMTRVGARRTETHAPRRDKRGRVVVSQPRIGWQILSHTDFAKFLHSRNYTACASISRNPYLFLLLSVGLNPEICWIQSESVSGGPMGRRGLLGLPAAPQDAISSVQYINFPKCQVLSVSRIGFCQDMLHGL